MSGVTVMAEVVASCSGSSGSGWSGSATTTISAHMPAPTTSAQPLNLLRPLKPLKQPSARRGAPHANATLVRFNPADGISLDGAMVGTGTVGVVMTHDYDNDLCGAWPFANYPATRGLRVLIRRCSVLPFGSTPTGRPWSQQTPVRLGPESASGVPELRAVQSVDQSIGGLVRANYVPTAAAQPCRPSAPPLWAR
jgi:hypothetical protein